MLSINLNSFQIHTRTLKLARVPNDRCLGLTMENGSLFKIPILCFNSCEFFDSPCMWTAHLGFPTSHHLAATETETESSPCILVSHLHRELCTVSRKIRRDTSFGVNPEPDRYLGVLKAARDKPKMSECWAVLQWRAARHQQHFSERVCEVLKSCAWMRTLRMHGMSNSNI